MIPEFVLNQSKSSSTQREYSDRSLLRKYECSINDTLIKIITDDCHSYSGRVSLNNNKEVNSAFSIYPKWCLAYDLRWASCNIGGNKISQSLSTD